MRSEEEQQADLPKSPSPAGVVAVLLLGLIGCILFGIRSCRQTPTDETAPAIAAVPQTNAIVQPTPAEPTNAPPVVNRGEAALAEAKDIFKQYTILIRGADVVAASNALQSIQARLTTRELQTNFWQFAMAPETRATLGLYRMCSACKETQGHCWGCSGRGVCTTCDGSGACSKCKGRSVRMISCNACFCRACAGFGRCRTCSEQGLVRCETCGGTGASTVAKRLACPSCSGTGKRSGLQRAGGEASQVKCLTCRGLGIREVSQFGTCPACSGKGSVDCARCKGSANCPTCGGRGRKASCPTCNSTGQVRIECPQCGGLGKCTECKGAKSCTTCRGQKSCPKCSGNGVTEYMTLPVDRRWMSQPRGFVVRDARTGERLASGSTVGPQTITVRGQKIIFTVGTNAMIWISTDGSFTRARELMRP